ncbi:molybdopterin-binding protein [Pararhodobacter sp. SW119]|uniref:molybdopterin-binding protein n=1 Tax=Pararhodobacter sp. SW119 TaxID=2780075 RepID=UPI001ADFA02B|nr:molybdopterin-binding protein [Pararhodobacter sp. SW119]
MRFGPVPLDQAEGGVLAHSLPVAGGRLRKGKRLEAADLAALAATGRVEVTVARLDPGDVGEDDAALALARAVAGPGLELQPVGTGRVNLLATGPGLARIDAARVDAFNAVDGAITLASVPRWQRMDPRGMVATVKIIAYAVPGAAIARACDAGAGALALAAPVIDTASLIQTDVGLGAHLEKGAEVTRARLERLGARLIEARTVPHRAEPLAEALAAAAGGIVLILTGSATSDAQDVAPAALRRAGGRLVHFGMPVDPGNLTFLGELGGRPVLGLPGSSRSPALSGSDWVLERLVCGVPVGPAEIMGMGVGGLLKEIPTRPRPRAQRG